MTHGIPFQTINWPSIEKVEHKGVNGEAYWQTVQLSRIRLRLVEYSPGYLADHWCSKGHVVHCLEGEFTSAMENGDRFTLKEGMGYVVSDKGSSHRSHSAKGAKLLIIDGDFLKAENNTAHEATDN